ncbi:MAG: rhodanese-like domain-containing protein [Ginsengibacter sp.]
MKKHTIIKYSFLLLAFACNKNSFAQNPENWTSKDLIQPAGLAAILKTNKDLPVIFNIGPGAIIPGSVNIGMVKDEKNLAKFKEAISKIAKTAQIVIYCGCCPYDHCPNVRPAIALLQDMEFTNYHLLDLPHNIKTDWIAKGYPVTE